MGTMDTVYHTHVDSAVTNRIEALPAAIHKMSDGSQCKRQRHAEDAHSITVSDLLTCTKQRKGQRRVVGDTSESMSHKLPTGSRGVDEEVLQGQNESG